ncbi:tetratricopeptide repeat protein 6 isoform X2 [Grammomys surdaster]|uniref:tetratricopeptide repeat protein 6 isoform X2 n=1 Tax=Grammomys surdaster TaxID=491861 RepID=UPI0010A079EF|nr:tetratricopeptide repeat protein 6 isoform X2 [Grammomys surdaster]
MLKNYDLAKFTIYQVAEMNKGVIELTPIQEALIHSFCENHDKAIHVLEGVIASKPDISTYALLAKAQMKAKRIKESVRLFKKALELYTFSDKGPVATSVSAECLYNLGLCYMEEGNFQMNYKLAVTDLSTAVNMDKNSYTAFYNRALCYTKIGEHQMALKDYGIVLLLDAGENIALNTFINRGLIYTELEQYGFALEDFKQAALMSETSVSLCQATAMCHHRIKEFEGAIEFFTRALKIDPHYVDAYIGRGNSYMDSGQDEAMIQAQKDFLKALHTDPSCLKARISLGYNLQAQGKFQKAWKHFTVGIEANPKSYLAYEGRAVVCLQMSNYFAAMQDINCAIKINSTAEFLTNRGVIHEFMGQRQSAMADYQAAISLDPNYSLAYFNAGNIYLHHRQFSQASDYFSTALKFNPENEYALMNRAVTNSVLKKYEEAEKDFSHAMERCPHWAALFFNRASFYFYLKKYELAEKDLGVALSLKPDEAIMYNLRAQVRGKIGLIAEAMSDYNQALDLEECSTAV